MHAPTKYSITPVAAAVTAALTPGFTAIAQDTGADDFALEEIIVTATKRERSVQEIPATVQAITQESLAAMGAKALADYARFVPSMNVVNYGPGSTTVVFRGAMTGPGFIAQSTSSIYLDEISVTQTGSQPDIRPVDIARVEALSGPQGTLYGSDAQAGTLRIITNQPQMNTFEAIFDGEVRGGGDSDMSYRGSLVFNVPLVEDKLALRVVGYNDHDGGFIDNVFGHTPDTYGVGQGFNRALAGAGTLDNSLVVKDNWNEADIYGGRVHLRWEMNDNWATTFSYHHQQTDHTAADRYDPFAGDLQLVRFHDEWREKEFNMGSLKIEGDLGFAELVAAVSYYDRRTAALTDVTAYAHYWVVKYCSDSYYTQADYPYYWANPETGYIVWFPAYCQAPISDIEADFFQADTTTNHDDKLTAEIRLQSSGDTFDWIVGAYFEDSMDSYIAHYGAPTAGGDGSVNLYQGSVSRSAWEFYYSNIGAPTDLSLATEHWHSQSHTDWRQDAIFGEITWHINDDWDLTLGGRYFERSNTNYYLVNHPGGPGLLPPAGEPSPWTPDLRAFRLANEGRPPGRKGSEDQFIPKVSLNYSIGDNAMVYGLYTQGVRQGGVNRSRGEPFFPNTYDSDTMDNYEIGYKSSFADGKGRFNLTVYNMDWKDFQLNLVDPSSELCIDPATGLPDQDIEVPHECGQPWQWLIANAGEGHIDGVLTELDYVFNDNWLIGLNYEIMEAETDTDADLNGDGTNNLVKGLRLPLVPDSKASAWLEYSRPSNLFGAQEMFIRTQWSYTGDSLTELEPIPITDPNPQFKNEPYTIGDLRFGIVGEDWQFDVFVNNLTDERAVYTRNTGQMEWAIGSVQDGRERHQTFYTNRPREFGIRYMKRWGD
jgi:outer membrane receptor protein involved in Fe transport